MSLVLACRSLLIHTARVALVWGVATLVARFVGVPARICLTTGAIVAAIYCAIAVALDARKRPSRAAILAILDARSNSGGLVAASATVPLGAWQPQSLANTPPVHWNARPRLLVFLASAIFVAGALTVPMRSNAARHRLEVGDDVKRLGARIDLLKEEKVVPPERAEAMKQTLDELQNGAAGDDPAKAWQAIDAVDEATSRLGNEAGEDAVRKAESLSRAESMASALSSPDLDGSTVASGMRELAAEMARSEDESAALTGGRSAAMREALEKGAAGSKDLAAIAANARAAKSALRGKLGRLGKGGMLDPKTLRRFDDASAATSREDLQKFLKDHKGSTLGNAVQACHGNGGVDRGRGDAPLFFGDPTKEADEKFKDHVLPPSTAAALADSDVTGLSAASPGDLRPQLSTGRGVTQKTGNASAFSSVVMPRHRGTVARYFERKH